MSTEFIYFQPKSSVKPEDPSSDEGHRLLQHFQTAKHQSGYQSSAWGRAVEDDKIIVWVVGKSLTHLTPKPHPSARRDTQSSPPTKSTHPILQCTSYMANGVSNHRMERRPRRHPTALPNPLPRTRHPSHNPLFHPKPLQRPILRHPRPQPSDRAVSPRVPQRPLPRRSAPALPRPDQLPHGLDGASP